jgi:hypothetical protein
VNSALALVKNALIVCCSMTLGSNDYSAEFSSRKLAPSNKSGFIRRFYA